MKAGLTDFFWVAGPKILAGGLQFGLTVVLLHHFDPVNFGVISVCLSGVLLSDSIIGGATDSGVLRLAPLSNASAPIRSLEIQQAGLLLKLLLVAIILLPALFLAAPISSLLFQSPHDASYLRISAAALVAMLVLRSVQMHYQVNRRFFSYGISDLASSTLKFGGIGLVLLLVHPSPGLVLLVYAIAPLTVAALILASDGRALVRTPFSRSALRELGTHVKWFLTVSATGTLIGRMDILLLSFLGGVGNAGIYSAAQVVALVPQLIGSYIAVVFSPRIMPMWENGTLRKRYREFQIATSACAICVYLIALMAIPALSGALFPQAFQRSGPAILALLPAGLCALVNFPLTILLLLFQKPRFLVAMDCVSLPVLLIAYYFAIRAYGVIGAAVVTTTAALVRTAIMQVTAWRLLGEGMPTATSIVALSFPKLEGDSHAS